jgi:hypothetical protein
MAGLDPAIHDFLKAKGRERSRPFFLFVIARSTCDEAIHSFACYNKAGLLRFARNDG